MISRCLASTENYAPSPIFFGGGFRGRRVAVSGGLPVARSTAGPASAAESEQGVLSNFLRLSLPCGAAVSGTAHKCS